MVTSTVPLAPRQLLSKIAANPLGRLRTPPNMLFSLTTNHGLRTPPVLPSVMVTTTASPDPLVLPSCMANRSAATMPRALISSGSTTDSHTPTLENDDSLHQDVIPADILDAWCQQPVYDCAVYRATTRNVVAAILNRANQSRISGFPIFTLINLFHHHPLNLAYTRFWPFLPIFSYLPRAPSSPSATHIHSFAKSQPLLAVLQLS